MARRIMNMFEDLVEAEDVFMLCPPKKTANFPRVNGDESFNNAFK